MIRFLARTALAMTVFTGLTIAFRHHDDRPLPTAGEWLIILVMVAIVTEVIHRIDDRYQTRRSDR